MQLLPPQNEILNLTQSAGTWSYNFIPCTPPDGSVLVWWQLPTHSATVSRHNQISGYSQANQWAGTGFNHSTNCVANLNANQRTVKVITEKIIVQQAGRLDL